MMTRVIKRFYSGCGFSALPKTMTEVENKTKLSKNAIYKCIDSQNTYIEFYQKKYPKVDYDKKYAEYHNKKNNEKIIKSGVFMKFDK